MILVIPSIELRNGECCQCVVGNEITQPYYNDLSRNPENLFRHWRRENSKSLYITDVDSLEKKDNTINVNSVLYLTQTIDLPILLYSNFESADECEMYLENGIYRLIVDKLLVTQTDDIALLLKKFTASRVVFMVDYEDEKVKLFDSDNTYSCDDFFQLTKSVGGSRIVFNYKSNTNDDFAKWDELAELSKKYNIKITLKNDINNTERLLKLCEYERKGIDSVILGKSLYENNFPCQKIWRQVEEELDSCIL